MVLNHGCLPSLHHLGVDFTGMFTVREQRTERQGVEPYPLSGTIWLAASDSATAVRLSREERGGFAPLPVGSPVFKAGPRSASRFTLRVIVMCNFARSKSLFFSYSHEGRRTPIRQLLGLTALPVGVRDRVKKFLLGIEPRIAGLQSAALPLGYRNTGVIPCNIEREGVEPSYQDLQSSALPLGHRP